MLLCLVLRHVAMFFFFFQLYGGHRALHVLTHSFPTRRSSDIRSPSASARVASLSDSRLIVTPARIATASSSSRLPGPAKLIRTDRSEEHTSELQSLMRISYAVFCLKKTTLLAYLYTTSILLHIISTDNTLVS